MRAMIVEDWCEPRDMKLVELPDPEPGAGQVAIDVRAVGCNFFDILIAQGKYQVRPPRPFSPGGEVAGVIRAVGPEVSGLQVGDRVFAMLGWGGYASVAVAREHGAEEAFDYSTPAWVDGVKQATGGRGADVIYDPVGGEVFDLSTK